MSADRELRRARPLLGTVVEIAARGVPRDTAEAALAAAFEVIAQVHRLMSAHDPASDVGRLNRGGEAVVHPWTYRVLRVADALRRLSGGLFDATAGGRIVLRADRRVRLEDGALDLGGIAKGFAVDRAVASLRGAGVPSGLVNAGGDLRSFGALADIVHLRDPRDPSRALGRVALRDAALASSARRIEGGASSGLFAPGSSVEICGASVRASHCTTADALTKLVMLAGEESDGMLRRFRAEALLVAADGRIAATPGWHGEIAHAA